MESSFVFLSDTYLALIIVGSFLLLFLLFLLLYFLVFRKNSYKKQAKEISKKFAYLDALLIGQDSQYIHRLEVISRTNLLYVEKYEMFSKRYKAVYENYDKFADSMIRQLNKYLSAKQYRNIKTVINDAKKAVDSFENEANRLTNDLKSLVKLEEDARQTILKLKEQYRKIKQNYFAVSSELESVSGTINKVFDKLDVSFANIEQNIDGAEYDEANASFPLVEKVITALGNSIELLPNLCSLILTVIPNKMKEIYDYYHEVEKKGTPLYHLQFKKQYEKWQLTLNDLNVKIMNLKVHGVNEECESILNEINDFYVKLGREIEDESYFIKTNEDLYNKVLELERNFLRISSLIPEIRKIYIIEKEKEERIETLRKDIDHLVESRRILDGFIHSGTKQPYSLLKDKLSELQKDFDLSSNAVKDFKAYIDSLRSTVEESFDMIHTYYYHLKEIENQIIAINVDAFKTHYSDEITKVYSMIDELYSSLQEKPINVTQVKEKAEALKSYGNSLFEEIEKKYYNAKLAESAIVFANRDRNHQNDVDQQLTQLEMMFNQGDFEKVYIDASAIFKRNHVEETNEQRN